MWTVLEIPSSGQALHTVPGLAELLLFEAMAAAEDHHQ
jgi:hypothetical protein